MSAAPRPEAFRRAGDISPRTRPDGTYVGCASARSAGGLRPRRLRCPPLVASSSSPTGCRSPCAAATHVLGVSLDVDRVAWEGRVVGVGIHPMGVDARAPGAGREPRGGGPRGRHPPRGRAAPRGNRPPRLHQGDPASPPRVRADVHPPPRASRARPPRAGGRPLAHLGGRVRGLPPAGGRARRAHQRALRHGDLGAGPLRLPGALRGGGVGPLPRRRRPPRHPHPRRDEPRRQGVRRGALRRRRGARAERVRGGGVGAGRGRPGEPLRHRGERPHLPPRRHHARGRAPRPHALDAPLRLRLRRLPVVGRLPRPARPPHPLRPRGAPPSRSPWSPSATASSAPRWPTGRRG